MKSLIPENIISFIEENKKKPNFRSNLIEVLHMLQEHFGYLEENVLKEISYLMNIPLADITGVVSFYHYFRVKKKGKYVICVCLGTACHVKGADLLLKKLKDELKIEVGETTEDGIFSLETARCLGTCALAPVIKIENDIYSNVKVEEIGEILKKYYKEK